MCLFIDINVGYLQVADCDTREYTDQKRLEMSVSEFVEQWTEEDNTEFVEQWTEDSNEDNGKYDNGKSVLYLKDWHFVKVHI